jgi:hypothetical protein
MRIEAHRFGRLVIDGQTYTSDLIIEPDGRIRENWRRRHGHRLNAQDIDALTAAAPAVIVAGTGVSGLMKPDPGLAAELAGQGIRLVAAANAKAVDVYNDLAAAGQRVGACFHLTC